MTKKPHGSAVFIILNVVKDLICKPALLYIELTIPFNFLNTIFIFP